MNRKFLAFILLVSAGFSLSSCLSNNDDDSTVTYYHDTAITSFSLGTMDKYGKNKAGGDSILKSAVTGSNYKFTIDQTKREIYNADSLPMNTRVAAVLATISAKNSSYIQLIYKGASEDSLVWYSSSDSVNFDKINPDKSVRAYAQDATAYADYKVKINIHTQVPDTFIWQSTAKMNAHLAALTDTMRAVNVGNTVYVFGKESKDGNVKVFSSTDGAYWYDSTPTIDLGKNAVSNMTTIDDCIYVLNTETHKLLKWSAATNWTEVTTDSRLIRLAGASSQCLFAYSGDSDGKPTGILMSKDYGVTWTEETLTGTSDINKLPTSCLNMVHADVRSAKNVENVFLVGTCDDETKRAVEWMRSIDVEESGEINEKWNMVKRDANQACTLPKFSRMAVDMSADHSKFVAFGTDQYLYESMDAGVTWTIDSVASTAIGNLNIDTSKPFAFTTVKENSTAPDGTAYTSYIYWFISEGNVWKGRYNKDGWKRQDP